MFKKLKEALKGFSKKAEDEAAVVEQTPAPTKEEIDASPQVPKAVIKEQLAADAVEVPKTEEEKEPTKVKIGDLEKAKVEADHPIAKPEIEQETSEPIKEEIKVATPKLDSIKEETKVELKAPIESPVSKFRKVELPKKGFFQGVTKFISEVKLTPDSFDKLFANLEIELLQNNIAIEIVEEIKETLQIRLTNTSLKRSEIGELIEKELHQYIYEILNRAKPEGLGKLAHKKTRSKQNLGGHRKSEAFSFEPLKILFIGVNGVGKTTTMAKVAKWFQNKGLSCVFAAGDTFRAASIEQLQEHADNLGIKMIKNEYGSDAAAVAFDAIKHAEAKHVDVVLIDTAGRTHANEDLMSELAKIKRVANPDLTLLVVDSLTGNDAVEQAKNFNDKIGIDGSILTKVDADEKGGALISVAHTTKKPIYFIGVGQEYKDLQVFDPETIVDKII